MPYTTIAWYRSVQTNNVLTELNTIPDPHVTQTPTRYTVPRDLRFLAGVYAASASLTHAHIESPSLRAVAAICVSPLNTGSVTPASPPFWMDAFDAPRELAPGEQLMALSAGTETSATAHVIVAFLSSGPVEPVKQPYVTVRATGTTTLKTYEWTPVTPTFETTLPVGRYRIIGFRAESTNMIAARLVVPGQPWRPGVLACTGASRIGDPRFRFGRAGVLAEFSTAEMFQVECLASAADTSQTFYFDLVRVTE